MVLIDLFFIRRIDLLMDFLRWLLFSEFFSFSLEDFFIRQLNDEDWKFFFPTDMEDVLDFAEDVLDID